MMQHHKWSLTELDDMEPWEREIYVGLLLKWLKEEEERIERETMYKIEEQYFDEHRNKTSVKMWIKLADLFSRQTKVIFFEIQLHLRFCLKLKQP